MFSAELTVRDEQRAAARRPIALDGQLSAPVIETLFCRVTDLSRSGARLLLFSDIAVGTEIRLAIPGCDVPDARIVWTRALMAGCEFDRPLEAGLFERLTGRSA